jgi:hypothetical protein
MKKHNPNRHYPTNINPKTKKKNSTVRLNPHTRKVKGKGWFAEYNPNHSEWDVWYNGPNGLEESSSLKSLEEVRRQWGPYVEVTDKKHNPNRHYPKTKRGRPTNGDWWILDFYNASEHKIGTSIGQGPKEEATREAKDWVGLKYKKKLVAKVLLSGPYARKPTNSTVRT